MPSATEDGVKQIHRRGSSLSQDNGVPSSQGSNSSLPVTSSLDVLSSVSINSVRSGCTDSTNSSADDGHHSLSLDDDIHGDDACEIPVPELPEPSMEYLNQLLQDKFRLDQITGTGSVMRPPPIFYHVFRILDGEIDRVRRVVFQLSPSEPAVRDAAEIIAADIDDIEEELAAMSDCYQEKEPVSDDGPVITLTKKIVIPVQNAPLFNYVGRILGPRGSTVKQLECQTGCKILVRGGEARKTVTGARRTSEDGIDEPLHVIITAQDAEERAQRKVGSASQRIQKLLTPPPDGMDDLKKRQLIELAILNGTYRLPPHLRKPALVRLSQTCSFPDSELSADELSYVLQDVATEASARAARAAKLPPEFNQGSYPASTSGSGRTADTGRYAAQAEPHYMQGSIYPKQNAKSAHQIRTKRGGAQRETKSATHLCNEPIKAEDLVMPEGMPDDIPDLSPVKAAEEDQMFILQDDVTQGIAQDVAAEMAFDYYYPDSAYWLMD